MDSAYGYSSGVIADTGEVLAPPANMGTDERRMHVRAYNHWVSLLRDRPFPCVHDLDPAGSQDFGPHGVLLDFTAGMKNPAIAWLGEKLRLVCGLDDIVATIADVPPRSLLSRLTDHHMQIIANAAPIGFEAEFVNQRGMNMMYRGILLPLSSDGTYIDYVYGVINWKEAPPVEYAADLLLVSEQGIAPSPSVLNLTPLSDVQRPVVANVTSWADGPGAAQYADIDEDVGDEHVFADLRNRAPQAVVQMGPEPMQSGDGEFVLLLARRMAEDRLAVIAPVLDDVILECAIKNLTK